MMFGEHHKDVLAELSGVSKRTVQRWFNGSVAIPEWIEEAIAETHELWGWQCQVCGDSECKQDIHCHTGDGA